MPFTISHVAAVLPLSRLLARWRLVSAVVIGSMVPDFRVFLPGHLPRVETHSATALLTFCLPVGMATYWVFQYLIKAPICSVLPEGAYARWHAYASPARITSPAQWLRASCAVLGGAVTHLVWDAFTHEGARGARVFPRLEEPMVEFGGHHVAGFRLMQDGSSLLGLAVVLAFICLALRPGRGPPVPSRALSAVQRRWWVFAYGLVLVVSTTAWLLWARVGEPAGHSTLSTVYLVAIASLRGIATAMLAVSLALRRHLRPPQGDTPGTSV